MPKTAQELEFVEGCIGVGGDSWVATERPAAAIADRINSRRQFTLVLSLETRNSDQRGQARILAISEDPIRRNLTLGRAGGVLVLRSRSFLTGQNADSSELQLPMYLRLKGYSGW